MRDPLMHGILSRLREEDLTTLSLVSKEEPLLAQERKKLQVSKLLATINVWRNLIFAAMEDEEEDGDKGWTLAALENMRQVRMIAGEYDVLEDNPELVKLLRKEWTPELILEGIREELDAAIVALEGEPASYICILSLVNKRQIPLTIIADALLLYPQWLGDLLLSEEEQEYRSMLRKALPPRAAGQTREIITLSFLLIFSKHIGDGKSFTAIMHMRILSVHQRWSWKGNDPLMWVDDSNSVQQTLHNLHAQVREDDGVLPVHKMLGAQPSFLQGVIAL